MNKDKPKSVTFNETVIINEVEYYDRYNWDLIDAWRKRDEIMSKWERIITKLLDKHQV